MNMVNKHRIKKIMTRLMGLVFMSSMTLSYGAISAPTAASAVPSAAPAAEVQVSPFDNYFNQSNTYLRQSNNHLYQILNRVNNLPNYLDELTKMALSWLAPDNSTTTANLQNTFSQIENAEETNQSAQMATQNQLLNLFFGFKKNVTTQDINNLSYSSLLNQSYTPISEDSPIWGKFKQDPAYNYMFLASALNITHKPLVFSKGPNTDPVPYNNYYSTVTAVQTFNGYVLSGLYAEAKNPASQQNQQKLVQQASSGDWFTQIASENLGVVLRQILLYNSQTYVLLSRLLKVQQELLISQTMNNSLLVATNQWTEKMLYSKATGTMP